MNEQPQDPAPTPEQQEARIRELKSQLAASEEEMVQVRNLTKLLWRTFFHETRASLAAIQGYAEIMKQTGDLGKENMSKLLSGIANPANRIGKTYDYFQQLFVLFEDVELTKVSLGEILQPKNFALETSVENFAPIFADALILDRIMHFLELGLFDYLVEGERNEADIVVSGKSDKERMTIRMQHNDYHPARRRFFENGSNELVCDEINLYFPFCVAEMLVNKLGGELFLEMDESWGTAVSFTLPVYKE